MAWHLLLNARDCYRQEAIMDWNELLALLTLGAVAPYVTAAAACWIRSPGKPSTGADAPP